jgi:hypothetical protein
VSVVERRRANELAFGCGGKGRYYDFPSPSFDQELIRLTGDYSGCLLCVVASFRWIKFSAIEAPEANSVSSRGSWVVRKGKGPIGQGRVERGTRLRRCWRPGVFASCASCVLAENSRSESGINKREMFNAREAAGPSIA